MGTRRSGATAQVPNAQASVASFLPDDSDVSTIALLGSRRKAPRLLLVELNLAVPTTHSVPLTPASEQDQCR